MDQTPHESLHRLVKAAMDSGAAASLEEAEAIFKGYRLGLCIDKAEAMDPHHQAALLTAVALARRVFLGGVTVAGALDVEVGVPGQPGPRLYDAVIALGGMPATASPVTPMVFIGGGARPRTDSFQVRTAHSGWRGGILPAHRTENPEDTATMHLAPMLAAALAINEAFLFVSGDLPAAGRRAVGLSLWRPSVDVDWLAGSPDEPVLAYLPSNLWLIGLGHLGQAYLWALGLLPYREQSSLAVVLQDIDRITASTESTSILTDASLIGTRKTRAMAAWAERRGFETTISERRFDIALRRQGDEPQIAFCGLDNAMGRRALGDCGFEMVVEAGLGRGHHDFRSIRLHTLPGSRSAADLWPDSGTSDVTDGQPAYQRLLRDGRLDQCGVTLLAGRAVGAPFVGAVAACLAISEVLRMLHGNDIHDVIDLDLRAIEHRRAVKNPHQNRSFNPGYIHV